MFFFLNDLLKFCVKSALLFFTLILYYIFINLSILFAKKYCTNVSTIFCAFRHRNHLTALSHRVLVSSHRATLRANTSTTLPRPRAAGGANTCRAGEGSACEAPSYMEGMCWANLSLGKMVLSYIGEHRKRDRLLYLSLWVFMLYKVQSYSS